MKDLDPDVWLPHFWFFLYTVAHSYPVFPNKITKRKYYDFIQNLPLYIPHEGVRKHFIQVLDYFPVTPYLDNQDSFTYWVHFIHNQVHRELGKEEYTHLEHLDQYYNAYLPKTYSLRQEWGIKKYHITYFLIAIIAIFVLIGISPKEGT